METITKLIIMNWMRQINKRKNFRKDNGTTPVTIHGAQPYEALSR